MPVADDLDKLRRELITGDGPNRSRALQELLAAYPEVPETFIAPLVECIGTPLKAVQRRAADALARVDDRGAVRAALEPELTATDNERRWGAAYALGRMSQLERRLLPVLFEVLGHPDGDRRWAGAELVVAVGRREPILADLYRIVSAGTSLQRKMGLYCLRDLNACGAEMERAVKTRLGDEEPGVRLAALATVGRCARSVAVVEATVDMLDRDRDPGVRRAAAVALGSCDDVACSRDALTRAMTSVDADLRRAAARALERFRGHERSS